MINQNEINTKQPRPVERVYGDVDNSNGDWVNLSDCNWDSPFD